ncbi:MAG: MoxR family ATPase [Cohnella sp.]|nr:MoxR family ATPase [Cohnella sp.]
MQTDVITEQIGRIRSQIGQVIVGKERTVDLMLAVLFAGGHALLEDVPGTGKTLLAKTFAKTLDCSFKRIQFTPDLLPSDLSGINFFSPKTGDFEFRPGPVFTNILLADEINRATPRTQSSLLECMEERQITIDGATHPLDAPFLVLATQNPVDNQGTFPLPEAQLDRFMMRIRMGYPTFEESVDILTRFRGDNPLTRVTPSIEKSTLLEISRFASSDVRIGEELLEYIVRLAETTRNHPEVALGVSPRGSQALLRASQAYALVQGRDYVTPDDIKTLVPSVWAHRLMLRQPMHGRGERAEHLLTRLLGEAEVPAEPAVLWERG